MILEYKKLNADAKAPTKAHEFDAGFDLYCTDIKEDYFNDVTIFHTGIAVNIPENYVGLLLPRSSVYRTNLFLRNSVGVVDAGYTGEIKFIYKEWISSTPNAYEIGDKVGQLIILELPKFELKEVESLPITTRGKGGFGSSGK